MIRRWLRGCLLASTLGFTSVGCTTTLESLSVWSPLPKDSTDSPSSRGSDEPPVAKDQVKLCLDTAKQMDKAQNDAAALIQYERVLALDPNNYSAMRRLCVLYDRRGTKEDFQSAEKMYQKVSKIKPNDAEIWSDWGYSLFLRGTPESWADAEKKLRHAIQLQPDMKAAHNNLGLVLGQLKRYPEAFKEFKAAQVNEAEAHCDLAYVYWLQYKLDEAKQELRVALAKDPTCGKAGEMLTVLEQEAKRDGKGGTRDRMAAPRRGDGRMPRASTISAAQEAAEHEAARRAVADRVRAPLTLPEDKSAPAPGGNVITLPSGSKWITTTPGGAANKTPPTAQAPAPLNGGVPGTISLPD